MRKLLFLLLLLLPAPVFAQLPMTIPHQNHPYQMFWNGTSNADTLEKPFSTAGFPCSSTNIWREEHNASGGWNNRGFLRFTWYDWDCTNHTEGIQMGYQESGSKFAPAGGWDESQPFCIRYRIYVQAPLLNHPTGSGNSNCSTSDTQMKLFLWGRQGGDPGEGLKRIIHFLWAGNDGDGVACGGTSAQTCLQAGPGIGKSRASTLISNSAWHDVQICWRWGASPYIRLYVDNDNEGSPTATNAAFTDAVNAPDDWPFAENQWDYPGDTSLNGLFDWMNMDNSGGCVGEDAILRVQDFTLNNGASAFDSDWDQPADAMPGGARAPRIRVRPADAAAAAGLLLMPVVIVIRNRQRNGF